MPIEQTTRPLLWPYVVVAVLSLLVSLVIYSAMLFLGITLAVVGATIRVSSRTRGWRHRGIRVLSTGAAVLIGPIALLLAASNATVQ